MEAIQVFARPAANKTIVIDRLEYGYKLAGLVSGERVARLANGACGVGATDTRPAVGDDAC